MVCILKKEREREREKNECVINIFEYVNNNTILIYYIKIDWASIYVAFNVVPQLKISNFEV